MSRCRACDADILWLSNVKTGKANPIDAEPNPKGNIERVGTQQYRLLTKAQLASGGTGSLFGENEPRYISHFATCTRPEGFRRCSTCHREPCLCPKRTRD